MRVSVLRGSCLSATMICLIALPFLVEACDTWVALPDSTGVGATILAKNSDRPVYDAQPLVLNPRATWTQEAQIHLGRLTIPQIEMTYATLGSQPYWCWGYEEGINEYGVAIGNEGVWTRPLMDGLMAVQSGQDVALGLTGMDLIRLGLERGRTAREALSVMIALLEEYGQLGSGLPAAATVAGAYDNSYIIADPEEAWIFETAGREWVARRVDSGVTSISNDLSIGTEFDLASAGLTDLAVENGWWEEGSGSPFHFADVYRDPSPIGQAKSERAFPRSEASRLLMEERAGSIDVAWMSTIARDRSTSPSIDLDATASSCVAVLPSSPSELPVFWWAPVRPSVSCYVPFFVHANVLPESVSQPGVHTDGVVAPSVVTPDAYADGSYWWAFRNLADLATGGVADETDRVRAAFDPLEEQFAQGLTAVLEAAREMRADGREADAAKHLAAYSAACAERALATANDLREQLRSESSSQEIPERLLAYLGRYESTFDSSVYTVLAKGGHLAIDVPGQTVYELNDPDEAGLWTFALSSALAVSFDFEPGSGAATTLILHQNGLAVEFLREGFQPAIDVSAEIAEDYVGVYRNPASETPIEVLHQNGRLAALVDGRMVFELHLPDAEGMWRARATDQIGVRFEEDSRGEISGLVLHQGPEQTTYDRDLERIDTTPLDPSDQASPRRRFLIVSLVLGLLAAALVFLVSSR